MSTKSSSVMRLLDLEAEVDDGETEMSVDGEDELGAQAFLYQRSLMQRKFVV